MTTKFMTGFKAWAVPVACLMFAAAASAEQVTPPAGGATTVAPIVKAAPVVTAAPKVDAAKTTAATKAVAPKVTANAALKVPVKKVATVSPCKGLDLKACGGNTVCAWIVPKDANDKTGKLQESYCRKIAGVALKKPAVAKPVATQTTTPASTTPAVTPVKQAAKAVVAKPVTTTTTTAGVAAVKPPAPAPAQ